METFCLIVKELLYMIWSHNQGKKIITSVSLDQLTLLVTLYHQKKCSDFKCLATFLAGP